MLSAVSGFVWGPVTIILLVGTGVLVALITKAIQLRKFAYVWKLISGKFDDPDDEGEITHFQALSAAISATIGTGNIAGVGTAIALGGPGAVLTAKAFNMGLPCPGDYIVSIGIIFFAFSTAIIWSYYGDRCVDYLFGEKW